MIWGYHYFRKHPCITARNLSKVPKKYQPSRWIKEPLNFENMYQLESAEKWYMVVLLEPTWMACGYLQYLIFGSWTCCFMQLSTLHYLPEPFNLRSHFPKTTSTRSRLNFMSENTSSWASKNYGAISKKTCQSARKTKYEYDFASWKQKHLKHRVSWVSLS